MCRTGIDEMQTEKMGATVLEERLNNMEKEMALLAKSLEVINGNLEKISESLDTLVSLQTTTALQEQKIKEIDANAREAFKRVYERIERLDDTLGGRVALLENTHKWAARTIVGTVIMGMIGMVFYLAKKVI